MWRSWRNKWWRSTHRSEWTTVPTTYVMSCAVPTNTWHFFLGLFCMRACLVTRKITGFFLLRFPGITLPNSIPRPEDWISRVFCRIRTHTKKSPLLPSCIRGDGTCTLLSIFLSLWLCWVHIWIMVNVILCPAIVLPYIFGSVFFCLFVVRFDRVLSLYLFACCCDLFVRVLLLRLFIITLYVWLLVLVCFPYCALTDLHTFFSCSILYNTVELVVSQTMFL